MKNVLLILLIGMTCGSTSLRAQTVADVSDLAAIQVTAPDIGTHNAGSVKDVLSNYPTLRNPVRDALVLKFDAEDEASALKRLKRLEQLGVAVPAAARNKVNTRAEKFVDDTLKAAPDLELKRKAEELKAQGFDVPAVKIAARIETLRDQREKALLRVKDTNPQRAKAKMEELLAAGIPITQATQDAVNAAQPPPAPAPTPQPTPNDGL